MLKDWLVMFENLCSYDIVIGEDRVPIVRDYGSAGEQCIFLFLFLVIEEGVKVLGLFL